MSLTLPPAPDPCEEGNYILTLVCTGSGPPTLAWIESEEASAATDAARLGSTKTNGCGCEKELAAAFIAGRRLGKGTK